MISVMKALSSFQGAKQLREGPYESLSALTA